MSEKLTIYHAVLEYATVTFLTEEDLKEFTDGGSRKDLVICSSEVTPEEYDVLSKWKGATT